MFFSLRRNINFGNLVVDFLHNEYPELKETFSPPGSTHNFCHQYSYVACYAISIELTRVTRWTSFFIFSLLPFKSSFSLPTSRYSIHGGVDEIQASSSIFGLYGEHQDDRRRNLHCQGDRNVQNRRSRVVGKSVSSVSLSSFLFIIALLHSPSVVLDYRFGLNTTREPH